MKIVIIEVGISVVLISDIATKFSDRADADGGGAAARALRRAIATDVTCMIRVISYTYITQYADSASYCLRNIT